MVKGDKGSRKKRRGRPPGRTYAETIPVRLTPEAVAAIDRWAKRERMVSRSEALRVLIERGLEK
jgi:metal-responsive CopG/Arc/MetJ family transcriptional regulator